MADPDYPDDLQSKVSFWDFPALRGHETLVDYESAQAAWITARKIDPALALPEWEQLPWVRQDQLARLQVRFRDMISAETARYTVEHGFC